ncbi:MAG: winged helix-turn-helix domain-containing protein [Thaumarchaeota archaeon]|nr:winged helix-turn-helix domain-containing protein [Nitrososphaerota archaeon]
MRRSFAEIAFDVLRLIATGRSAKTKLMLGANTSSPTCEKALDRLKEKGLIIPKDQSFLLTPKGAQVLDSYKQSVGEIFPELLKEDIALLW